MIPDSGLPTYQHAARESWLQHAIRELAPWFLENSDDEIPVNLRVTVGFGPTGSRQESIRIMGGTLHTRCSADGAIEIFISPESPTAFDMLGTLVHELVHAILLTRSEPRWWGHSGPYADLATDLGLFGPLVSSVPGEALTAELERIVSVLKTFPGAPVTVSGIGPVSEESERQSTGPKRQTKSRYLLVKCTQAEELDCYGYQARITRVHLDLGAPSCPNGHEMVLTD